MLSVVYADCLTFIVMLGVVMLSVVMLSVAMLSIVDTFQTGLKTASRARLPGLPTNYSGKACQGQTHYDITNNRKLRP
jgi:hypothetical protein